VKVSLDILGEDRVAREFVRIGERATDLSDAFDRALDHVQDAVERQFATQGGGKWAPLATSTIARKGHARILIDTGALRSAATSGANRRVSADEATFEVGSGAPYWIYHHSKAPRWRLPRRPLLEVDEPLKRDVMREIQRELFGSGAVR
jgi:phage gpG-like protein